MPPKQPQNASNSIQQEGRIQLAIEAFQKQEISTITAAARVFNVSRSTLRERLHGRAFQREQRANNFKLTQFEEETLLKWVLSIDSRGAAPRPVMV